jgi:hypothetical protein
MPFENVTRKGIEKNFEQIITGLKTQLIGAFGAVSHKIPVFDGWSFDDYMDALAMEVGDAADKLYEKVENHGTRLDAIEAKVAALRTDEDGQALIEGRLEEEVLAQSPRAAHLLPGQPVAPFSGPTRIGPDPGGSGTE